MLRIGTVAALNVVVTVVTAGLVGPAASKLHGDFGLVAWAARAPFYLLPLLLTPLTLWVRPKPWQGLAAGVALAIPLALWARATDCPLVVQMAYIVSAGAQGFVLGWIDERLSAKARARV